MSALITSCVDAESKGSPASCAIWEGGLFCEFRNFNEIVVCLWYHLSISSSAHPGQAWMARALLSTRDPGHTDRGQSLPR